MYATKIIQIYILYITVAVSFSTHTVTRLNTGSSKRTFSVDYDQGTFLKDGLPFRYISGCIHYFRIPPIYWRDRLKKMRACGLDAIETYIPWNFHQKDSASDRLFSGPHNVTAFIEIAQEEGLLVIVRGFPYSDTEWDMGGLPYWLLNSNENPADNPIVLRSSDTRFMSAVYQWLDIILPILKPQLYSKGGPIIMVQVENEYGSYYTRDATYMKSMYATMKAHLGDDTLLFTTDGNGAANLRYGGIQGALHTVDFGPGSDPKSAFDLLRKYQPNGPFVNSEYYTGWLDHWGEANHHRTSADAIVSTFDTMLSMNASVNFYMFAGGTNFEYWSGSNFPPFQQITTSYDYDSPLSEAGDTTYKYFKIRETIAKHKTLPSVPVPANISVTDYPPLQMSWAGGFWDYLEVLCTEGPVLSTHPKPYEDMKVFGGYVLYRVVVPDLPKEYQNRSLILVVENGVNDYAQVFTNHTAAAGTLDRSNKRVTLGNLTTGQQIDILVESRGRVCFGSHINETKGINGTVRLLLDAKNSIKDGIQLESWKMYRFTLENLGYKLVKAQIRKTNDTFVPTVYVGELYAPNLTDTYMDFSGGNWTSGYVIVNGYNLGKYQPKMGPQKTQYLPVRALADEEKVVRFVIFETVPNALCSAPGKYCTVNLVHTPNLG